MDILLIGLEQNFEKGLISDKTFSESVDALDILKGGKRASIGETRMFGGREYVKTSSGWKFHGKGTGAKAQKHKEESTRTAAFTAVKQENLSSEMKTVLINAHKQLAETTNDEDVRKAHLDMVKHLKGQNVPDKAEPKDTSFQEESYGSDMNDSYLKNRLDFYQKKEKDLRKEGKQLSFNDHSKVRALEKEWSRRNNLYDKDKPESEVDPNLVDQMLFEEDGDYIDILDPDTEEEKWSVGDIVLYNNANGVETRGKITGTEHPDYDSVYKLEPIKRSSQHHKPDARKTARAGVAKHKREAYGAKKKK